MFVDACAIVSIIDQEPTRTAYQDALQRAQAPFTSPLAAWEAIIILSRPDKLNCRYSVAERLVREWLQIHDIPLRDGDPDAVLSHAVAVAETHGLGKRHLANFDCFHYAQAKTARVPLLTLDEELRKTDVRTLP